MKASGLDLEILTPTFGVECKGIDLSQPQSESTDEAIMQAWYERGLLLFRDQKLDPEAHVAFTRRFGEFEIHIRSEYLLPDYPEILVVGNPRENGRLVGHYIPGDGDWHSDQKHNHRRLRPYRSSGRLCPSYRAPAKGRDSDRVALHR